MLTKLGKYEIRRELGRGAMGIVYEGFDPYIERAVALKTVLKSIIDNSEAEEAFNRFRREAQAAGRLTHPNIVSVYEYGEDNDVAFIAMEFITGRELKDLFDKGERFPIRDSVRIMLQLLSALEYAHAHGVVHRDIKPANIVIAQDSQIKVVDFGIARIESSELTQVGTVLGTPTYMSPEQFLGLTVDGRSDIYSAGVILYQFLTGERPFTGNMATMMQKVLNQAPVPPSTLNPDIPRALEEVVLKAMAKRPEDRFQNAAEFTQALNQAMASASPEAIKTPDADATLVAGSTRQPVQPGADTPTTIGGFDLSALMADIAGTVSDQPAPAFQPVAAAAAGATCPQAPIEGESTLLTRLAQEAQEKIMSSQPAAQETAAAAQSMQADQTSRRRRMHEALSSLEKYFIAFAQHANKVEPAINRIYRIGRQRVYSNLVCKNAFAEGRRLDLTETSLLDFVLFGARLWAPKPAMITWPWDQKDELKEQLQKMKLKALDDLDMNIKKPRQEWLEVHLAPDFPLLLKFRGDYDAGRIEVQTMNLEALGFVAFKIELGDVTPGLMDDIGLFLLGRADKLPEALRRA